MPLDATGYLPQRVLTEDEADDLAILKAARHRIRYRWMWWSASSFWRIVPFFYGGSCAIQAVNRAMRRDKNASATVVERLRAHLPEGRRIGQWNDNPLTTHADILSLFDRAIAELE
jgi:hypothetical protein